MNEVMATTQPPMLINTSTDEPADITTVLEEDESNCDSPYTDGGTTEVSSRIGSDTSSQKDDSSTGLASQEATGSADKIKPLAGSKRK